MDWKEEAYQDFKTFKEHIYRQKDEARAYYLIKGQIETIEESWKTLIDGIIEAIRIKEGRKIKACEAVKIINERGNEHDRWRYMVSNLLKFLNEYSNMLKYADKNQKFDETYMKKEEEISPQESPAEKWFKSTYPKIFDIIPELKEIGAIEETESGYKWLFKQNILATLISSNYGDSFNTDTIKHITNKDNKPFNLDSLYAATRKKNYPKSREWNKLKEKIPTIEIQ